MVVVSQSYTSLCLTAVHWVSAAGGTWVHSALLKPLCPCCHSWELVGKQTGTASEADTFRQLPWIILHFVNRTYWTMPCLWIAIDVSRGWNIIKSAHGHVTHNWGTSFPISIPKPLDNSWREADMTRNKCALIHLIRAGRKMNQRSQEHKVKLQSNCICSQISLFRAGGCTGRSARRPSSNT